MHLDGRRIQIAWMQGGKYPGMPFNQQMSLPVELALRTYPEGVRLVTRPVIELDALRGANAVGPLGGSGPARTRWLV